MENVDGYVHLIITIIIIVIAILLFVRITEKAKEGAEADGYKVVEKSTHLLSVEFDTHLNLQLLYITFC